MLQTNTALELYSEHECFKTIFDVEEFEEYTLYSYETKPAIEATFISRASQ